ncbi:MAG: hypothetical protein ACI4J5_02815 [Oscillospiraceae bacterium]
MKCNKFICAAAAVLLLCGCSSENAEPSEDAPYDHGKFNIMETDKGYYYNNSGRMRLMFCDKATGEQVLLCAKPECPHDGSSSCTATYKGLSCINSVLYDGAIYILTVGEEDDIISYKLLKASLDGTELTETGTAFSVSNSAKETYEPKGGAYFIIHKGYAYLPYHLTLGDGTFGFAGSGLVKMDISSGRSETIFEGENYFSPYPQNLQGDGNYIYYEMYDSTKYVNATYRYNVTDGTIAEYTGFGGSHVVGGTISGGVYYTVTSEYDEEARRYTSFGIHSDENSEEYELLVSDIETPINKLLIYDDRIITAEEDRISVYDKKGALLGRTDIGCDSAEAYTMSISDDKLYKTSYSGVFNIIEQDDKDTILTEYGAVYSVPISGLISGKGSWKKEYGLTQEISLKSEELIIAE